VWTPVIFDGLWNNSVMGEGSGMGWRGFYPSSLCEHVRRGRKAMANCESEPVKMIMLLGDYVKVLCCYDKSLLN
jgi:amidase